MAEEKQNLGENIQENLSKVEQFIEDKKQSLMIGGGVLLAVVVALIYVFVKWLPERNLQAQKAMYLAEIAFAKDSFELALNGRAGVGNPVTGFAEVAGKYSFTKAANLANYYAGICCLHLKKYDEAIKYLDKFSTKDPIIGAVKLSATGDAYMELGKIEEGIKYYEKAAAFSDNETYTPYFLFKAGLAHEKKQDYASAKEYYEKVRDNYPKSEEARDIEKYIARATR
jgi:tetratricopeptide (TPR) repeat protein